MEQAEFWRLWKQSLRIRISPPNEGDREVAIEPCRAFLQCNAALGAAFLAMEHKGGGIVLVLGPVPLVQIARALRRVRRAALTGAETFGNNNPVVMSPPSRVTCTWIGQVSGRGLARFVVLDNASTFIDVQLSPALHDVLSCIVEGDHPLAELIRKLDAAVPRLVD